MNNYDPLIWGKNSQEKIVSIEINDANAELFIQQDDGSIEVKLVPNKFWLLANSALDKGFVRLKGDQHYKWGRQFTEWSEYSRARGYYKDKVWGIWNKQEALMVKDGYTYFKGMQVKDVSVLAFDIETTGVQITSETKVLIIANTFRDSKGNITRKMFCYDEYESDREFIESWCNWVREVNPSVIIGHNIYNFDIPMLDYIANFNGTKLYLGRDGSELEFGKRESRFRKDGSQTIGYKKVKCFGRSTIDTMFLAIRYDVSRKYESYGLKSIIKYEGLEKQDRQFYDSSQIKNNYENQEQWELIKSYAQDDGDDALALYDLMIPALFYSAQNIPKTFTEIGISASGAQLNSILVRSYLQNGYSIPKGNEITEHLKGGISFAVPGIYKNVFKIDLKSAYPSQVLRFNLYDKYKDPEAHFYKMVKYFAEKRFEYKKLYKDTKDNYYRDLDSASKIFLNSAFGLCQTQGLNFNSPTTAARITEETRTVLNQSIIWASSKDKDYWINLFKEKTGQIENEA
jgi:DNA polymerase, archaea type